MRFMKLSAGLSAGMLVGITSLSAALGAVPSHRITDDTAIYQRLSEIRAPRENKPNFDSDINRLSAVEGRYKENLPSLAGHPRLHAPIERISAQRYRYSGRRAKHASR